VDTKISETSESIFKKPAYKSLRFKFIENIPTYMSRLNQAVKNENEFKNIVHEMKGAFSIYGFNEINENAKQILDSTELNQDQRLAFCKKICVTLLKIKEDHEMAQKENTDD
jgi:HPt (histidine-containing phosphotransfer) domain-containing protein